MFNDQSNGMPSITSSQRELQSNAHPLQREENSESTTALQKEPSTIPPQGWNSNHQYQTRFKQKFHANHCISEELSTNPFDDNLYEAFIAVQNSQPMPSDNELNFLEHYACAASTNPDVLHYGAMLKDTDHPHFENDMKREIKDLLATGTVELILRSTLSADTILPAIWSFRRKRAPDWTVIKYKARVCPHGGKQVEGENYWATYAPVVNWRTV